MALRSGQQAAGYRHPCENAKESRKDVEEAYDYHMAKLSSTVSMAMCRIKTYEKMAEGLVGISFITKSYRSIFRGALTAYDI
jgi:hypothetical protein